MLMKKSNLFDFHSNDYFNSIIDFFSLDTTIPYLDVFGEKLFEWTKTNIQKINVVSIFSGAGGLDIGFRDAGFNIISHLELETDFCETLKMNAKYFNYAEIINIDIRDYCPISKKCDFIIGGPPCQTFSAASRRAAGVQGIEDHKGTLFEEYIRLLNYYNPKGFLFENVYGITGAQSGKAWELIKKEFSNAGYKIYFRILNTADYGVPQLRERMIIVGVKEGNYRFPRPTHGPDSHSNRLYYSSHHALLNVPINEDINKLNVNGRHGYLLGDIPPGLNYSFYTEKMGHPTPIFAWRSKFSDYLYKADPEKPVRTIKAQAGQYTGPLHWENRYLTINEFKRLQSFPDNYKIYGNRQRILHQIGNSVPPQFSRMLALSILNQVFHAKLPFEFAYLSDSEILTFRKRKTLLTEEYTNKARKAMPINTPKGIFSLNSNQEFCIFVTPDFKTLINQREENKIQVKAENKNLIFSLFNNKNNNISYEIAIIPTSTTSWNITYDQIILRSYSNDLWSYTLCWKALEYFLKTNKIKDDIVQLNGYYQYKPAIDFNLNIVEQTILNNNEWLLIFNIVKNKPIRKIMSYRDFSFILNTDREKIDQIAINLKNIGYEIRNHNTNPQIKKDHILLPYLFPTLSNLSVQLRKSL
jgi:DNA (cytosine-5)-methyltransferase 1